MSDESATGAEELQFDRAEVVESAAIDCLNCQRPIPGEYWTLNGKNICGACRHGLKVYFRAPVGAKTWLRILLHGGGAALLGTALYFAVLKITGYELGLIAVIVGVLVGRAVRKASGNRGGWKLQAAAMALTYCSIVSAYIPTVFEALTNQKDEAKPAATKPRAAAPATADAPADEAPTKSGDGKDTFFAKHGVLALFAFGAILFVLAAAAPVLAGFQNIMGMIIIGIALYEAWKITRRAPLTFMGPYRVQSAASP